MEIAVFRNPDFGEIRTLTIDNEPWFVGKDVADRLGYSNPSKAVITHVDSEDKESKMLPTDSQNGKPYKTTIINESGLYSLILSSKLPTAKAFKHWVTSEVLPSIRKTGTYAKQPNELDVDTIIKCAEMMCTCLPENKPEVMKILKTILPNIETDEQRLNSPMLMPPDEPDDELQTFDEDGCLIDTLGRRQPPRTGCQKPFDHKWLQRLCVTRKLTDVEVAKGVGCTAAQVYKWRTGKSRPTDYFRTRLCVFFGLPMNYFTING